jgi:hypothetical protein
MHSRVMCLALLAAVSSLAGADEVRLAARPARTGLTLLLGAPPQAMVVEEREVSLGQGRTTLELSWQGTRVVADSIRLAVAGGDAPLRVGAAVMPADLPQRCRWEVDCPEAWSGRLRLTYLIEGLTWEPSYTLRLDPTGKGTLSVVAAVRNDTGEDFRQARIDLGLSAPVIHDLEAGQVLRIPYAEGPAVAGEVFYRYDAAETNAETTRRLELANTVDAGLGRAPLPAGTARLFEGSEGQSVLTGELRFPDTPIGATAKLQLGLAREVSVERRVIASRQVDAKMDARGRLALWDQEEEVIFLVESQKGEAIVLRVAERIEGEWRMLSNSHEFEKKDAEHIELVVPVPAHAKITVRYKVRRLNLLP